MRQKFGEAALPGFFIVFCLIVGAATVEAQQPTATLRGQITDSLGAIVVNVTVTAIDEGGIERAAQTDEHGQYVFPTLPLGRYAIRVDAAGFSPYENPRVEITAGRTEPFDISLTVAGAAEEVTINLSDETEIGTDPENNADAVVLRGDDLDSLPDDPEDLAEALQALAGPSAGVDAEGQFYIDGFTSGRLPPKESIREIRINRNPFSAEYDRLGYGRVEIFSKPGTDKFRGQAFFNFNDESLNSRSPFAPTRAPYQSRRFGGNASGPLVAKKLSFFVDYQRRAVDDNDDINANVLDPALNIVSLNQTVLSPSRGTTFSPRFDWQINETNTLVARYTFEKNDRINEGIGGFNLASRAFDSSTAQHTVQLTETSVINQKIINETRFQYERNRRNQAGGSLTPTVRVLDAFTGGGAQIGLSFNNQDRIELQNFTSWTAGAHSLKAGGRLRAAWTENASEQNFAGTYTFGGGEAPQLDANNQIVRNASGSIVNTQITSVERYRRTLLFQRLGLAPAEIRARGGGATQFSISGGNPLIEYSQTDFSPFVQDDWRVNPDLTLSFGLRYDWQSNINSNFNFAPRFGFAWSPQFGARNADTNQSRRGRRSVIRGGIGIFYNNFNESLLSQTLRFTGATQQQFVITTSTPNGFNFLDLFPAVPTAAQFSAFAVRQSIRRLDEDLRTPYTIQTSFSYERQLPFRTNLSVNFVNAQTRNVLRSRNINAPLPGTFVPGVSGSGIRPSPTEANVFQYESTGRFDQQQLIFSLNNRFSQSLTMRANYTLNWARSDTEGLGSFPINQYDTSGEYGRSTQDTRHRVTVFGTISGLPWDVRLNPIFTFNSGRPFNITTGRDTNGDTLFTERPAFADAQTAAANLRVTPFGDFDVNPQPGQTLIPRNYGIAPSFSVVNLRVSKTFGFGGEATGGAATGGRRNGRNGGNGGNGGRQRRGGAAGNAETGSRYNLNLSVNIQNLLNNTNESVPSGNLSSPVFGISNNGSGGFGRGGGAQTSGNRRVELQLRFSF